MNNATARRRQFHSAVNYFTHFDPATWERLKRARARPHEVLEHTRLRLDYTHQDLAEKTKTWPARYANLLSRLRANKPVSLKAVEAYFNAMGCDVLLVPIPRDEDSPSIDDLAYLHPLNNSRARKRRDKSVAG